jgi:hypothetical protein
MGLLRSLAHTIFGFLLLTALWVTALSFLSMRPASTAVITDLGVNALNPFLVSKHIGLDQSAYDKLQLFAKTFPDKSLPITFIKPTITSQEIKGLPYDQGVRLIYGRVADAYYDGGPSATFNLPGPIAGAMQTFALFPQQYDTAVKSTPLPTWLQPFLLYTGLSPETLTASGHQRISAILPKFWIAALLLAGVILLLNLLGRKNPVQSLALAAWHGTWPTLAFFGVLWLIGHLYPDRVHPVAAAFGVVAGAFVPVYVAAAAVGLGAWLTSKFAGALFKGVRTSAAAARVPVAARAGRSGYSDHDDAPAYVPGVRNNSPQPPTPSYQPGARQDAGWNPPQRQSWEQPPQQGWGGGPAEDPRRPAWDQPRPWDAPDPNAPRPWDAPNPNAPHRGGQGGQGSRGAGRGGYPPSGPDDPTAPGW